MDRGVVDIDGVLSPASEARISVFDRGFMFGDSAFEVMRTYGLRPFHGDEHLTRLARSCERLRIPMPLTLKELSERITRAVKASALPECYLRIVVTRGVGPLGISLPKEPKPSVVIYAMPLEVPAEALYRDGIQVGLVHVGRATDGTPAAGAKTSNYLTSVLALEEVKARGCLEAIVVGAAGELIEGATSNLFVVRDGVVETPPAASGLLEGITRRTVFQLCAELGIVCRERTLTSADLYAADEAFITSSIREMLPVVAADGVQLGSGRPGPIYTRLLAAYRAHAAHA